MWGRRGAERGVRAERKWEPGESSYRRTERERELNNFELGSQVGKRERLRTKML